MRENIFRDARFSAKRTKVMSEIQLIETVLAKTATRRRWQRAWLGAWYGLLVAGVIWLVTLGAYKLFPLPMTILFVGGIASFASIFAGFVIGWCRRPSLLDTARWVDGRNKLQERLSTALEVTKTEGAGPFRELVVRDAAQTVSRVNPKQLLPFRVPQVSRWALLVLALGAGLGFVPEYRTKEYLQKQAEAAVIQDTGRKLAELTRRSLQQRPPALEPTQQAMDSVVELGDHMAKAQLTRSDALKDLANVTEKLKEQAKELGKNPGLRTLERAMRNPNKGGSPGTADLQKQIEAMQKSLASAAGDSEALDKLKRDLQQAKEAAAGLPNNDSAESAAARDDLAQSLSDLAKQAQDLGLSLPSLDEAIAALAASQIDQMLRDLDIAEMDLQKLKEMAQTLEQMQMNAQKLGKDLPEQLANGQPEAAQSTLQRMIQQLNSAGLTKEQLEKISDEVSRAVDPAGEYGKVADYLKKAAGEMQSGQKQQASESLAAAAKELEEMMQQLADANSLMATLDALQRAQMCVGNGQKWGAGAGTPRAGKGGGIGAGVGTWADDSRWMDLEDIKDRWDNSGVQRPDEDPRGITDRGDAQMADNLSPTKLRGQINPGGQMPSITLKGVSIKGMSKVDFQEAATTAQSDAESALSQEQVPRAYRGAVRDYFDDLKE